MPKKDDKATWVESPFTGRKSVLAEYDDKNGGSYMDIELGYFTNDFPLNYKKNPDFDISTYENGMPKIMQDLRRDDGESYWYPSTIQTKEGIVFPVGTVEELKWCFADIKHLTDEEKEKAGDTIDYQAKIDMENAKYYDRYMDAIKNIKGYNLDGELPE